MNNPGRYFSRRSRCGIRQLKLLTFTSFSVIALFAFAGDTNPDTKPTNTNSFESQITHGEYLVHHVAQCIQCHTPRDVKGKLIKARSMTGAVIHVTGPTSMAPWATQSVDLAGLGNYQDSFVRYLLVHGERPDGSRTKSPMPTFRLSEADADAVVAYLKTL